MTDLPKTMLAAVLTGHGGPEMLQLRTDVPVPSPGADEVLIRVRACGLNNTDINTRVGWYSKSVTSATADDGSARGADEDGTWGGTGTSFPRIQGADPSGSVVAVGADADPNLMGQRVLVDGWIRDPDQPARRELAGYLGSERDGGFAQYVSVPARNAHPHASSLTDAELASFPCSWSTAEHMLHRVNLSAGQSIAVRGASGGVGSALVVLSKLRGARVVAVAGAAKTERVAALGADHVVARGENTIEEAQEANGGPFDVVADVVGGDLTPRWLEALRRGGRWVCAGAIAGPMAEFDIRTIYLNDLELIGATVYEPEVFANLMSHIRNGSVSPVLARTFPIEEIHAAQEAFVDKAHVGAIVVTIGD